MAEPRVDPIRCIKYKTYAEFEWLKDVPHNDRCVPPKDESYCSFLASRQREGDGVVHLTCGTPSMEPIALLTENGELYTGLSKAEVRDYYAGTLKKKPTRIVDKTEARTFFIRMFGGAEFTPAVREEVCRKMNCTPPPSEYGD